MLKSLTIKEATKLWIERDMIEIPLSVVQKLQEYANYNDFNEITPIITGDTVFCCKYQTYGEVIDIVANEKGIEIIKIELQNGEIFETSRMTLLKEYDDILPMWGSMWSFKSIFDQEWLNDDDNKLLMTKCGFRIYDSEDYGYVLELMEQVMTFMKPLNSTL